MTQPAPEVNEQDARRVLRRDYAHADLDELWETIGRLEVREKWRVVLGCMKIAAGKVDALHRNLNEATGYYREILGEAEYPLATRKWSHIEKLSQAERQAIYDKDWRQYQEWLQRP